MRRVSKGYPMEEEREACCWGGSRGMGERRGRG